MNRGTLIVATLIAAPSSTENRAHERDPEMHQTKKGNQWHFGLKAHIGADEESGLVRTVVSTAANVSDISRTANLPHGKETVMGADAGYVGAPRREDVQQKLSDNTQQVDWRKPARRSRQKFALSSNLPFM